MRAKLILENGVEFEGNAFGYPVNTEGEIVFSTCMTGYQETLTDPSYAGQIVVMTYPLIGNYGANLEDMEFASPKLRALIVHKKCDAPNNWRCEMDIGGFLKLHNIPGLEGIDTRKLTKIIRNEGAMKARLIINAKKEVPDLTGTDGQLVRYVTCKGVYSVDAPNPVYRIAVMDFGVKNSILTGLTGMGCSLAVFPAFTSEREIFSFNPDAVFLSNGPGNPADMPEVIENIKRLCEIKPIFGVGLGHQLIGLANRCYIKKLKFGHHGANHPVKDLQTGRIHITSQNHNYVIESLDKTIEVTHTNLNDGSIEGIRHKSKPVMGVQFDPDATPGLSDIKALFSDFLGQ